GQRPYAIPGFLIPIDGVIASAAPVAPRRAGRPLRRVAANMARGPAAMAGMGAADVRAASPATHGAATHGAAPHRTFPHGVLPHAGSGGGGAGGYTAYGTHERYAALQRLMLRAIISGDAGRVPMTDFLPGYSRAAVGGGTYALTSADGRAAVLGTAPPPGLAHATAHRADVGRWFAAGWVYHRSAGVGSAGQTGGVAGGGLIGGSQMGVRAGYRLGQNAQLGEAFARINTAGRPGQGAEGALGVAICPMARVPVQLAAERRQALAGTAGRSAFAIYAYGGVNAQPMPAGWRLDGYGAAGVVGLNRSIPFAEGAAVITHDVGRVGALQIGGGAGAWAAAQTGAARVDIGPRLTASADNATPRLSVDWRQRVGGVAAPQSGIAITLASDF
ncbi:MAG: hypothetical protein ACKOUM_09200, partial [Sphingopyxis sp.]